MAAQRNTRGDAAHERYVEPVGAVERNARRPTVAERYVEPFDRAIAVLAGVQHGVVTRAQLLDAGLTRHAIAHRLDVGTLHALHRGVFAVGHPAITKSGQRLAAVLTCGARAALSHFSAAVVWELLADDHGTIHVTSSTQRRPPAGVTLHRAVAVRCARRDGVPVTTPVQTILDLAATVDSRHLERAVTEARLRRLVRPDELLAGVAGRRGARRLVALLADEPALTRSEAERRLLALLARAGLPRPRTNIRVQGHEVDAWWPEQRLIVEVDGFAFHSSRAAFERDRVRDAALQAGGNRVVRVTWRQLTATPEELVARLAAAIVAPR